MSEIKNNKEKYNWCGGKYRIKSTRLKYWNYAEDGYYFITICAKDRENYFGDIIDGEIKLSNIGKLADKYWRQIPGHFPFVVLDEYMVMPNHIHGIIIIDKSASVDATAATVVSSASIVETRHCLVSTRHTRTYTGKYPQMSKISPRPESLSVIIGSFKSILTRTMEKNNMDFAWQSRFYDHIIRDEKSLMRIRQYIIDNPIKWELDRNNQENLYM